MDIRNQISKLSVGCAIALTTPLIGQADDVGIGELYSGDFRVEQEDLDKLSLDETRLAGMRMFTKPFIKQEGYGDGDDYPPSPTSGTNHEGERGTLQGNGTYQRINGLDAQTCLECHSVISRRKVPATFGIGGVGGINNTVLGAGGATSVDLTYSEKQKNINGRNINPPFTFGAGGIELLANEMTIRLNEQLKNTGPGKTTKLKAKGISFGTVTKKSNGEVETFDHDDDPATEEIAVGVKGLFDLRPKVYVNGDLVHNDNFLVVAPFGRKGDNKSTRTFDTEALSFHFGMQVGNHDDDNDDVHNEVTEGELSALSVFVGTQPTPFQTKVGPQARRGKRLMRDIGCTDCHRPKLQTETAKLGFRFPEIGNKVYENVYLTVDLTDPPMNFEPNEAGGVTVELFADLKRHYMGPSMAEFNDDAMFTTMRLWGVADTAPYLHDGRALTIKDAIVMHGADTESEAFDAVSAFNSLSTDDQKAILAFLDTLRVPNGTFPDLLSLARKVARDQGVKH